MRTHQDVLIEPDGSGHWILYNVFTHNTLATTHDTLEILSFLDQGASAAEVVDHFEGRTVPIWDIGRFSNYDGLFADPTGRLRATDCWPEPANLDVPSLLQVLASNHFITSDEAKYRSLFEPKRSLLDQDHLGELSAYHQEIDVDA